LVIAQEVKIVNFRYWLDIGLECGMKHFNLQVDAQMLFNHGIIMMMCVVGMMIMISNIQDG